MKTFAEFKNSIQLEEKPIYTRREGEAGYDLVDDNVFNIQILKVSVLQFISALMYFYQTTEWDIEI